MTWISLGISFLALLSGPAAILLIFLARKIIRLAAERAALSAFLTSVVFASIADVFFREILVVQDLRLTFFIFHWQFASLVGVCWFALAFVFRVKDKAFNGVHKLVFFSLVFLTFLLAEYAAWSWFDSASPVFKAENGSPWATTMIFVCVLWSFFVYRAPPPEFPLTVKRLILYVRLFIAVLFLAQLVNDFFVLQKSASMRFPFSSLLFLAVNVLFGGISLWRLLQSMKGSLRPAEPSSRQEAASGAQAIAERCSVNKLSNREIEILAEILAGASNKEIAQSLQITANTVKNHIQNIFRKTGTSSRFELLKMVF